jgi:hypothetical protein
MPAIATGFGASGRCFDRYNGQPSHAKNHSASALVRPEIKARSFRHVTSLQSRRLPCLTRARFRANQTLYGSVLGGEWMTVLTGGACQLTGLPELAIQLLPTGWGFGGPLGVANRATAATYNRAGG